MLAGLIKIPDTFPIYAVKLLLIRPLARKVSRGGVEWSGVGVGVQWGAGGPGVLGRERWGAGCVGGGRGGGGGCRIVRVSVVTHRQQSACSLHRTAAATEVKHIGHLSVLGVYCCHLNGGTRSLTSPL